ncbi:MAG: ubiquinone biosynthesis methyltransferase UbiE [Clostridiales bacterium GWB2_37_7]|nr:MAG: ubiquinone biosynthesis methyltransferase UbiE [Clostridiales bacterium GWB2_37_7]
MAVFDKIADSYDSWYLTKMGSFVDQVETELAFGMFDSYPGMKVLDVGCGTGNFSIKLAQQGCKVIGIDISDEMLDIARTKAEKQKLDIEFCNMDVYNLQFETGCFDAVFSMAAFEFIVKPQAALDEMMRVTKKGGQIFVGTISRDSKWGELYLSEPIRSSSVFKYACFKTLEDLRQLSSEKLINSGQCLFIPPDIDEDKISIETEQLLSKTEKGGYICALWKK